MEEVVEKQKMKLPKIGMRIIKTTIAVLLCFITFHSLGFKEPPLIATICAILCMQQKMAESMEISIVRIFGTSLGALAGLFVVYLLQFLQFENVMYNYIIISLAIIPIFYVTILLRQADSGALTVIVFLCIIIADGSGDSPFGGAMIRAFETILGIIISLAVNMIHFPRKKEKDFLFITKFDQILYKQGIGMTPYCSFELNLLIQSGIPITVVTGRTPAFLQEHMEKAKITLPVITMDGAVLYDMNTKHHIICREIYIDMAKKIIHRLEEMNLNYYVNCVFQDVMFTYHKDFKNPEELRVYEDTRKSPFRHYVYGSPHYLGQIVCISLIVETDICQEVERILKAMDKRDELIFIKDTLDLSDGYMYLKIYDQQATKQSMVKHLLERTPQKKTIIFGGNHNDRSLMRQGDLAYAIESSPKRIKVVSDGRIKGEDDEVGDLVLRKIFHISQPLIWQKHEKLIRILKNDIRLEEELESKRVLEEQEWL